MVSGDTRRARKRQSQKPRAQTRRDGAPDSSQDLLSGPSALLMVVRDSDKYLESPKELRDNSAILAPTNSSL